MSVFVDTSALLAALDSADRSHSLIGSALRSLLEDDIPLVTTNYVLVETFALVQRRLGMAAAHALQQDLVPALQIEWLDLESHHAAMDAYLAASKRHLSFVDCTSFEVMRRRGLRRALSLDDDFSVHGFERIPT